MIIAHIVTLTADDTGQTLRELLEAAGVSFAEGRPVRFATLKLQQISNTIDQLFVVSAAGPYTVSAGNIPTHYGWNFSANGGFWEMQLAVNAISVDDIVIGGVTGETLSVFAYSV